MSKFQMLGEEMEFSFTCTLFPFAAMTRGGAGGNKMIEIHDLPRTLKLSAHQMMHFLYSSDICNLWFSILM